MEKLNQPVDALSENQTVKLQLEIEKLKLETEDLRSRNKWTYKTAPYIQFVTVVITVAGFCFGIYQFRAQETENQLKIERARQEESVKVRRLLIEKQLSEFYYPISLRLQLDNELWPKMKQLREENRDEKLRREIEKGVLLPNLNEILTIILAHADIIKENEQLRKQTFQFIKHTSIQKSLRATEEYNRDAPSEDANWPAEFEILINSRARDLQQEYNNIKKKAQ